MLANQMDELDALKREIEQLKFELNNASPYCPICGSCGHDGCCSAERCLYPSIKAETLKECKDQINWLYDKIGTLFDAIKHGDQEHQDWLQKAIKDHFEYKIEVSDG